MACKLSYFVYLLRIIIFCITFDTLFWLSQVCNRYFPSALKSTALKLLTIRFMCEKLEENFWFVNDIAQSIARKVSDPK